MESCSPYYSGTKLRRRPARWVQTLLYVQFQPHITNTVPRNSLSLDNQDLQLFYTVILLPFSKFSATKTFCLLIISHHPPSTRPAHQTRNYTRETEPRNTTRETSELLHWDRSGPRGLSPLQNGNDDDNDHTIFSHCAIPATQHYYTLT